MNALICPKCNSTDFQDLRCKKCGYSFREEEPTQTFKKVQSSSQSNSQDFQMFSYSIVETEGKEEYCPIDGTPQGLDNVCPQCGYQFKKKVVIQKRCVCGLPMSEIKGQSCPNCNFQVNVLENVVILNSYNGCFNCNNELTDNDYYSCAKCGYIFLPYGDIKLSVNLPYCLQFGIKDFSKFDLPLKSITIKSPQFQKVKTLYSKIRFHYDKTGKLGLEEIGNPKRPIAYFDLKPNKWTKISYMVKGNLLTFFIFEVLSN